MPVKSGPTWPPVVAVAVAFRALFLEDDLAAGQSPPSLSKGVRRSSTFWRSGSGKPPPLASNRLARSAIFRSGCVERACF